MRGDVYMKLGIDISSYNGNVDMKKIKQNGIEFAILRLFQGSKTRKLDKKFNENYSKAIDIGIFIGVYVYSYATNKEQAIEEAKRTIQELKGLKLEYPIFIDMEDADNYKLKNKVDYSTCVEICEFFCDYIEKAGYYAGIYANLDWFNNKINSKRLDRFDKWVAQWSSQCDYEKTYGIWQYTSKGEINGIDGYVDLNYSFKDYPTIIRNNNLNQLKSVNDVYIVQKGDTLENIAKKYNTNWKTIYNLNKSIIGNNPNFIRIGERLIIKGEGD